MKKLNFALFSQPVEARYKALESNSDLVLVRMQITGDALWDEYLKAYPAEVNDVFRTRHHYDGNYDKSFIRRLGNVVGLDKNGEIHTIWDVQVEGYFQAVADKLNSLVRNSVPSIPFLTEEKTAGQRPNKDPANSAIVWTHFFASVGKPYLAGKGKSAEEQGEKATTISVFKRGLTDFTLDAANTVLELIMSNSLYRGAEHKQAVVDFINHKTKYESLPEGSKEREAYVFYYALKEGMKVRFRPTVIGTLVEDLSLGKELEYAVKAFETKVAPANYKRTSSLVTPRMVEEAQKTLESEGLVDSLYRRHAVNTDMNVQDILFTSQNTKALNIFDDMKNEAKALVTPKMLKKVEEISIADFVANVLPIAKKLEVLFEPRLKSNLMSLIAPISPDAKNLFKWDNSFSWAYNGDVADSLKERVKEAGGNVEGYFRVSLAWFNGDDLDLSLTLPSSKRVYFSNKKVENFNLDLDMNGLDKHCDVAPVENIFCTERSNVKDGTYIVGLNNYSKRSRKNPGFTIQIEIDGEIVNYTHEADFTHSGSYKPLLTLTIRNGKISSISNQLEGSLVESSSTLRSEDVWGLSTNTFVPVKFASLSPNFWNNQEIGNKHYFFFLENCLNPETTRGFYNEFLRGDLEQHRKVFEILGTKTKVDYSDNQLSGVGMSSTVRNKLTVRVTGLAQRVFIINF